MCKPKSAMLILLIACAGLCPEKDFAQKFFERDTSEVAGNWKGSSICQVKNSSCHDEIVEYNILLSDSGTYHMAMNKMVDGKVDFMGELEFAYDAETKTLSATNAGRIWQFTMRKNIMDGIVLWHDQLYRKIHLEKQ